MQAAVKSDVMSVAEYLAAEETGEVRHEYLGGLVYAMAGETTTHNQISQNLAFNLRPHLKGGPCKIYISSIRVSFDLRNDEYYYYPDVVVTCDKRDTPGRFVRHPKLIVEVLSESTARVDKREKFFAYSTIASLEEYVLVEQDMKEVTVFRRAGGWKAERFFGQDSVAVFKSLKLKLPLSAIYEGV